MLIRVADLTVQMNTSLERFPLFAKDYRIAEGTPDFSIDVSPSDIVREKESLTVPISDSGAESNALCRKIAYRLPFYQGFLLHAAVVEMDGVGYGFSAASGTGKSTHISYWKEYFGPAVRVINGDKPFIRMIDGEFYAYGSPWCGKEGQHVNARVPLRGLAFLERSDHNFIEPLSRRDAVVPLFHHVLLAEEADAMSAMMLVLDSFAEKVPMYRLGCTLSPDSARVAYERMKRK